MKHYPSHSIYRQQYEITLADTAKAETYQSRIGPLQERYINTILQKVMDQYHHAEYWEAYDQVVLDLGTITEADFDTVIQHRIEEALAAFLQQDRYPSGDLKIGKRTPLGAKQLERLAFFLNYGYLRWDASSEATVSKLFQSLLLQHKEALIALVRTLGQKAAIRKRLITQLDTPQLEQIVTGVAQEEGTYINQYRQGVEKQQQQCTLVQVGFSDFRAALWDITLSYLFTEVTSHYSRKHFLKYLITKTARNYNLTYSSLLKAIASGLQEEGFQKNTDSGFSQFIKVLLQEENQKTVQALHSPDALASQSDFVEHLAYFVQHRSLPTGSAFHSRSTFHTHLKRLLEREPSTFHRLLQTHIQHKADAFRIFAMLPDSILNQLALSLPTSFSSELKAFLEAIKTYAKKATITSPALAQLQKGWRKVALYTYYITPKHTNLIEAFLIQMVTQFPLDGPFIALLKGMKREVSSQENLAIRSFLKEVTSSEKREDPSTKTSEPSGALTSEIDTLYQKYASKRAIPLKAFRQQLTTASADTLVLARLLLDACTTSGNFGTNDVEAWIRQRQSELKAKGKSAKRIIAELAILLKQLGSHPSLLEGIAKASEESMTQDTSQTRYPVEAIDRELIPALYQQLSHRSPKSLQQRIKRCIQKYAKVHQIPVATLFAQLQQHISATTRYRILHQLLDQMGWENYETDTVSSAYQANMVVFFLRYGKLPWWTQPEAKNHLQAYLKQTLETAPALFKTHFTNAKDRKSVLALLDEATYEILLQHTAATSSKIYSLKKTLDELWEGTLAGIRSLTPQQRIQLRELLLQHAATATPQHSILPQVLMTQLAKLFNLSSADLNRFVAEARGENQEIGQPRSMASSHFPLGGIKGGRETEETETIALLPGETLLTALKRTHKENPDILRSLLRQRKYREPWIIQLDTAAQTALLQSLLPPTAQNQLEAVLHVFRQLKKHLPSGSYQKAWAQFVNVTLLKVAVDSPVRWTVKTWGLLIHGSLISLEISQENQLSKLGKALPKHTQKIVEEVYKIAVAQKKGIPVKKELPFPVKTLSERFAKGTIRPKDRKNILARLDEDAYETLVQQLTHTYPNLYSLKKALDELWNDYLTGLRPLTQQQRIRLRELLFQQVTRDTHSALPKALIPKLAKLFDLSSADLNRFVAEVRGENPRLRRGTRQGVVNSQEARQLRSMASPLWPATPKAWGDREGPETIALLSGEALLTALKQAYSEDPITLRSLLKQQAYREQWIARLNTAAQTALLQSILPPSAQTQLEAALHLFRQLKQQLSTAAYQKAWVQFLNFTLLKVAVDHPVRWTINTWGLLLYPSLATVATFQENLLPQLQEILPKRTKAIVAEAQKRAVAPKKEEPEKEEPPLLEEPEVLPEGSIRVTNAGMALLGPYIPMLLERMALIENGTFKDEDSQHRAIHLLQYAVTGQEKHSENELVLNKVLCGLPLHSPIASSVEITPEEREQVDGMLHAIIAHWKIVKNTTIGGLRETFLCREGQLTFEEEKDVLRVAQGPFDMLLDHIPWGISKLKFSWMPKVLEVIWKP